MIRDIYLLQRGTTQPYNEKMKTGDYIKLDYMGSSEFEWGAIPKFQREVFAVLRNMTVIGVQHGHLVLYALVQKEDKKAYSEVLLKLMKDELRLKERSGLKDKKVVYDERKKPVFDHPEAPFAFDCWFDLTNNVVVARDQETVERMRSTIPNSIRFMAQQKGA